MDLEMSLSVFLVFENWETTSYTNNDSARQLLSPCFY